jgi:FkbM family methyltransferase
MRSISKPEYVLVDGMKLYLDKIDSLRLSVHPVFEPFETSIIRKYVKKGDYVLDLGANIGYYTLIMSKIVGDKGKVFAFEPDENNFNLLKKSVETNNLKNVVLFKKGVADYNGTATLYLEKLNSAHHMIHKPKNEKEIAGTSKIEIVKIDDVIKDKISFIKMDVEGSEAKAIKGMGKTLLKNKSITLITEFAPEMISNSGEIPETYLENLKSCGFKILNLNEDTNKLEEINIKQILNKHGRDKEKFFTNLLCIK